MEKIEKFSNHNCGNDSLRYSLLLRSYVFDKGIFRDDVITFGCIRPAPDTPPVCGNSLCWVLNGFFQLKCSLYTRNAALAISYFQILPVFGDKGDKIPKKYLARQ